MSRYFLGLSIFALLLMLLTFGIGLFGGDYNGEFSKNDLELQRLVQKNRELNSEPWRHTEERDQIQAEMAQVVERFAAMKHWTEGHVLLGITTGLVVLFVNSLSVTYFIGTSRWCREVVETYEFDPSFLERGDAIKAAALPYSIAAMVMIIVLAGLGAASYRGASLLAYAADFVVPHQIAAWLAIGLLAWSHHMQAERIAENGALIEELTDEVARVRKERGLPTEEEDEEEEEQEVQAEQGGEKQVS